MDSVDSVAVVAEMLCHAIATNEENQCWTFEIFSNTPSLISLD
jgi:hypothetical protein